MADHANGNASSPPAHPKADKASPGTAADIPPSPDCHGGLTLCTIASSVSNLAVTEGTTPLSHPPHHHHHHPPPSTSDQEMSCCCPPKRIRICDSGARARICSPWPQFGHGGDGAGCTGQDTEFGHGGDGARSTGQDTEHRPGEGPDCFPGFGLTCSVEGLCQRQAGDLTSARSDLCLLKIDVTGDGSERAARDSGSGCVGRCSGAAMSGDEEETEEKRKRADRGGKTDCGEGVRKASTVLSKSPYHCHDIDGKLAERDTERSSSMDGRSRLVVVSAEGAALCLGGIRTGATSKPPPGLVEHDAVDYSRLCLSTSTFPAAPDAGSCRALHSGGGLQSETSVDGATTVMTEVDTRSHTDQPQSTGCAHFQPSSDLGMNVSFDLSKLHEARSLVDPDFDASPLTSGGVCGDGSSENTFSPVSSAGDGSCPLTSKKGSETDGTSIMMMSGVNLDPRGTANVALARNAADDDDDSNTSDYSDSSSDSSSSLENSPRQSSVASARIFHHKLQCASQKKGRSGKARHRTTRTPRYGLKTDAVDDLIGVRRGGHGKNKHHLYTTTPDASRPGRGENPRLTMDALTIDDLPTVLLVLVFSFLPVVTRLGSVSQVCKRWQAAVLDPSLWRRLDLRNLPRLKDETLLQLTSLSDRVSSLILSDGRSTLLTDGGVSRVLQQCQYLTKVKFNRCFFLSDDTFQNMGKHCHSLVYLNLSGCFTVTDRTLLAISEGCPLLQDLGLGQCARITDTGVCAVARGCPHLVGFRVDQCGKLTNQAVEALANHCPDLQFLHLLSCAVTDEGISHLSKLVKLQVLDLSNVSQLSRRVVEAVAGCCPLLETLALSLNRRVDDRCLQHVVTRCPRLRCLSCVACGLSDQGLRYVAAHARNLERLDVAWCADITDQGVEEVVGACPRLRYVGLMRCPLVTTATVERLMQAHPAIHFSNFELESRRLLGRAGLEQRMPPPATASDPAASAAAIAPAAAASTSQR
ncbi:uncharacterized protein LOC143277937 [Babylonia areolata]|uniref:uncharacterized protein LOC143277937 n=1 Tax=Babylonia areolata TaxID=304850 RepID=UPI003FD26567